MRQIDCVVVGHNVGNFQDYIGTRQTMAKWLGAYRDAQINSVPLDGRRVSYMELFNVARQRVRPEAESLSAFDPLGLAGLHLVSFLARRGLSAALVGEFQRNSSRLDELLRDEPTTVAITTTFYFEPEPIKEIVRYVRQRSPGTTIIIGGPYPSQLERGAPMEVLAATAKEIGADVTVIESQGELTLWRVIDALKRGTALRDLTDIPNLLVSVDGAIVRSGRERENNPINDERVDWGLFDHALVQPFAMMRTAISCPFACSFCSYPIRAGEHILADVDRIEAELRTLARIGVRYLYFVDDTFNVPLPRFKQLCRMMIKNQFPFHWISYLRCGNMDEEAVGLAAESGCRGALLGIESGDRDVLQQMNKFASPEKYRKSIRLLEDAGIMTWALMFVGFPGDTEKSVRNTISLIEDTAPSCYATQMWFYDHTTPIHRRAQELGLQGNGYGWKHKTMAWQEACDGVEMMLREIKQSLYVPQTAFSFETIFYLMGRKFDRAFVMDFLRISRDWVVDGLGDAPVDQAKYLSRLDTLCAGQPAL